MGQFTNFTVAGYVHAQYLHFADEAAIDRGIAYFQQYLPLDKVYLETHRGIFDIPEEKMDWIKAKFRENGIAVSGGITSTISIKGHEKNNVFDVFCFTDPVYREKYLEIAAFTAKQFDEVILDDFFFTACRCNQCRKARGNRSWAQFRLDLMEEFAREVVRVATQSNPNCKYIIKYPNWYESYQECGYNPEKQKDIFAGIYTGTESRDPQYAQQHLQRYLSYSLVRYLENVAPGKNGGGWIDRGGSSDNLNMWLEQASLTLYAGAKELTLFNFEDMVGSIALPPLRRQLERVDAILSMTGNPIGVSQYEPHNADGEDQLVNYLGMTGIPFEPTPDFDASAPVIFLPASAAHDENIMKKLEAYVASGGHAIVTTGFIRKTADKGIYDMTSVRLTGRRISGKEYWIDAYYANHKISCTAAQSAGFEVLDYKTNATWCEIAVSERECNFPVLLNEFYGDGHLFILNIPDNFADLYLLPKPVLGAIGKVFAHAHPVYLNAEAKYNLFLYDNDTFLVESYRPYFEDAEIIVRGEDYTAIEDLETGKRFPLVIEKFRPTKRFDSAKTKEDLLERAISVPIPNGVTRAFRLVK